VKVENVLAFLEVVPLSADDYRAVLKHLSEVEIVGGATYDALIAHAALKADVAPVCDLEREGFSQGVP
jgi:hypothetical protein